jgi:hypothetical protein
MKSQAPSNKIQANSKHQILNSKRVWGFDYWNLGIVCNLEFVI